MNRLSLDNFYELITDGMQFQVSVPYVIYRNAASTVPPLTPQRHVSTRRR